MKVTVEGTPKEITDFVSELQSQFTEKKSPNVIYKLFNDYIEKNKILVAHYETIVKHLEEDN